MFVNRSKKCILLITKPFQPDLKDVTVKSVCVYIRFLRPRVRQFLWNVHLFLCPLFWVLLPRWVYRNIYWNLSAFSWEGYVYTFTSCLMFIKAVLSLCQLSLLFPILYILKSRYYMLYLWRSDIVCSFDNLINCNSLPSIQTWTLLEQISLDWHPVANLFLFKD